MSNSGKPFNSARERGGAKGFGEAGSGWKRPDQQKGGKVFKKGQEFRPVYDSGLGKDPIDRSLPQSLACNTDSE
jgi:hypothetical protein